MGSAQGRGWQLGAAAEIGGVLQVPGDKSISHRALLFLAIAEGGGEIRGLLEARDCLNTLAALRALGARIDSLGPGSYRVVGPAGGGLRAPDKPLDLGNSGTGLRLLTGLLAGLNLPASLTGDASLCRRPMGRIVDPLNAMGAAIRAEDGRPPLHLASHEGLQGIDYAMPVASAQVKSAILLAGLHARGETRVREPAPTRDHSERMLAGLGADIEWGQGEVRLRPGGLRGQDIDVPADFSSAAFFVALAAARPGAEICLRQVGINPTRDGLLRLLKRMGAAVGLENQRLVGGEPVADIRVTGQPLEAITVSAEEVALAVDEIPALMIAAARARGTTHVEGAAELRVKESDRIAAMAEGLQAMGLSVETRPDGLSVTGGPIRGGRIASRGDHRIAMSFAMLGALLPAGEQLRIDDVDNVATSFPDFIARCKAVGVNIQES